MIFDLMKIRLGKRYIPARVQHVNGSFFVFNGSIIHLDAFGICIWMHLEFCIWMHLEFCIWMHLEFNSETADLEIKFKIFTSSIAFGCIWNSAFGCIWNSAFGCIWELISKSIQIQSYLGFFPPLCTKIQLLWG